MFYDCILYSVAFTGRRTQLTNHTVDCFSIMSLKTLEGRQSNAIHKFKKDLIL
jgi:hypothetical protein